MMAFTLCIFADTNPVLVLFTRPPQGMQLTQEGQTLKSQAEEALAAIDDLSRQAQSLRTELSGVMTIGLHTDPAFLRIDQFFSFMARALP